MARKKVDKMPDAAKKVCDNGSGIFGRLYLDVITSPNFKRLKPSEQLLYGFCCIQTINGRACVVKAFRTYCEVIGEEYKPPPTSYFVFPPEHQTVYGLSDKSNISKRIKALIDAGLVDKVFSNRLPGGNYLNVYRLSSRWKS